MGDNFLQFAGTAEEKTDPTTKQTYITLIDEKGAKWLVMIDSTGTLVTKQEVQP